MITSFSVNEEIIPSITEIKFCTEKVSDLSRWHHLYGRKRRRTKEPLDESDRGEWKSWLKTQHSEN